ncbi:MAG: hypothetical protein ACFFDN_23080 [Candidatus Hodarchaeota archaeon]
MTIGGIARIWDDISLLIASFNNSDKSCQYNPPIDKANMKDFITIGDLFSIFNFLTTLISFYPRSNNGKITITIIFIATVNRKRYPKMFAVVLSRRFSIIIRLIWFR